MRLTRIGQAVAAAVMTIVAAASIITFTGDSDSAAVNLADPPASAPDVVVPAPTATPSTDESVESDDDTTDPEAGDAGPGDDTTPTDATPTTQRTHGSVAPTAPVTRSPRPTTPPTSSPQPPTSSPSDPAPAPAPSSPAPSPTPTQRGTLVGSLLDGLLG